MPTDCARCVQNVVPPVDDVYRYSPFAEAKMLLPFDETAILTQPLPPSVVAYAPHVDPPSSDI